MTVVVSSGGRHRFRFFPDAKKTPGVGAVFNEHFLCAGHFKPCCLQEF
jgi:hypothetical protein